MGEGCGRCERTRRRCVRVLVALGAAVGGLALVVAGCGGAEPRTGATGSEDWPAKIRFGLVPSEGGTDIVERFAPLMEFVEREVGVEIETSSATEYIGVITAMQNKQVDFAYLGPKSYIEASNIAGAEALVKEVNVDGTPGYYGIIIAHRDSGMETLADARGKDFAFVTPNSTSGYLVPTVGIFAETGVSPEAFFGEIRYTGSHGNSVQAVLRGDVSVAATNEFDLRAMANSGHANADDLVELWRSDLIPSSVIAARSDVPESLKRAVADAILRFGAAHPAELAEMSRGGFVEASDADYDVTRLLEQRRVALEDDADG